MYKTIGMNPIQYLNQYRLLHAKHHLTTTNKKIIAIAEEVGILDSTYFSRLFKQYVGITPTEYRRVVLGKGDDL